MDLLIVTGMSGAGKSQAIDALEDIGYYCVDNVPPHLLGKFAELPEQSQGKITRIALVMDVRSQAMSADYRQSLEDLRERNIPFRLLFLSCDDGVLQTRYRTTRRPHPLQPAEGLSVQEAVALERELLQSIQQSADYTVDTTLLSAQQLRSHIRTMFSQTENSSMLITCMSFGFKHGSPANADLLFDVRCLPNPYYNEELRPYSGLDEPIRAFLAGNAICRGFEDRLLDLVDYLAPLYVQEGKSQLVIAVGCTGGRHRSVFFADRVTTHLADKGFLAHALHRDIDRP